MFISGDDLVLLILVGGMCFSGYMMIMEIMEPRLVWLNHHKAFKQLVHWIECNQDACVGDYQYARGLVIACIEKYEKVKRWYPFPHGEDVYLSFLYMLLDQHGPEPPRKVEKVFKQPKKTWAVLFLAHRAIVCTPPVNF